MLTPVQGRKQREAILKEARREERKKHRAHLASLRQQIRDARAQRKAALAEAKTRCRTERLAARDRANALRDRLLQELRDAVRAERQSARQGCSARLSDARAITDRIQRTRAELEAERHFDRQMRRIEAGNRQRTKEIHRSTARERRRESDDVVSADLPAEYLGLWQRMKGQFQGTDRMTRTEQFLHFLEENPELLLQAMEDRSEQVIRDLERREREARSAYRTRPRGRQPYAEAPASSVEAEVPF
jgi:hypothetical protein